jgi:hypothetical protein
VRPSPPRLGIPRPTAEATNGRAQRPLPHPPPRHPAAAPR